MVGQRFFSVAAVLSTLCACALASPAAASTATVSFTTPGCTTWTVPAGVTSVQVQAVGSAGFSGGGGAPGLGDGVSGTLSGVEGATLYVCVDQGGGASVHSGGTGGGASGVSLGSDFSAPMVVAGGGGGGGAFGGGGAGGNAAMPIAGPGANTVVAGGGGGDNTAAQGGAAGTSSQPLCNGSPGGASNAAGPGVGGAGGGGVCGDGGGSGGGGYFAGGGGAASGIGGAGGGGGTDFCAAAITDCVVSSGVGSSTDSAQVTITYALPVPTSILECQHAGWTSFGDMFKNQGACVSFVARGGG
jgi:hypothetical protein